MTDQQPAVYLKYTFKAIPKFDPLLCQAWISDVRMAFRERKWLEYLTPVIAVPPTPVPETNTMSTTTQAPATPVPAPTSTRNPDIEDAARIFLLASIPWEYRADLHNLKTVSDIFASININYNSATEQDEMLLEGRLRALTKLANQSIDAHINA